MYQELSTGIREKSRVEEQEHERKLIAPSTCALCAGWRLVIVLAVILAALMGRWTLQRQSASSINAAVTGRLAEFAAQTDKEIVGNLGGLRVTFPPGKYPDFLILPARKREVEKRRQHRFDSFWLGVSIAADSRFGNGK